MKIAKERKKAIALVTVLVMVLAAVSFFGITMLADDNTDAADIDDTMTSLEYVTQEYTGSALEPMVTVMDGATTLVLNTDYTVSYAANTNVGTATVTITGIGNYSTAVDETFAITQKALDANMITITSSLTYTGDEQTVLYTVMDGALTLSLTTDYTVTLNSDKGTNAGSAYSLEITGAGNYTGTVTKTWAIAKANVIYDATDITQSTVRTFDGNVITFTIGNFTAPEFMSVTNVETISGQDYINAGSPTVNITLTADSNHTVNGGLTSDIVFTATISPLAINVIPIAASKNYGSDDPTLTYAFVPALKGTDAFTGTLSRAVGEDVGTYAITIGTLALSSNYTLTFFDTVSFVITPKELTIVGATATNRVYNATVNVAVSGGSLVGVVDGDEVNLNSSAAAGTMASPNAGVDIPVLVTGYALYGADIGNYTLTQPTDVTVTITAASVDLTLSLFGTINETDRSSVTVTAIGAIDPTDIYGGDVVNLTYAWYVNGVLQAGQTSSTYTTSDVTMLGKTITLVLSVDNTSYSASRQESYVMYYYVVNVDPVEGSSVTLFYNNGASLGLITHATGTNLYYVGEETMVIQRDTFNTGSMIYIEERAIVTEPTEERQHYGVTLTTSDTVTEEGYVVLEADLYSLETADMRNVEGMYYLVYVYGSSGNKVDCFGLYVPTIAADGTASWNIYVQDLEGLTAVSVTITIGPGDLTPVGTDATDRWLYEV